MFLNALGGEKTKAERLKLKQNLDRNVVERPPVSGRGEIYLGMTDKKLNKKSRYKYRDFKIY